MPPYHHFLTHPWVESTLNALSPRQQMAQLLHVAGWSNRGQQHTDDLLNLIEHYGIGGIIFFQGTPERQLDLTRQYQEASRVPLLISIDAEWGLGMRLDKTLSFPYQIALGAIQDDQLIYDMGRDLGTQCRRLGIHMNFAPCVDVNTESGNPVIGFRSFGSDPHLVARKGRAYMDGLQDAGILAVAKHFPGHGDTKVDSHFDLPTIPHHTSRLEKTEFYPFRELIRQGVSAIMPGHIRVPALDDAPNIGATLSYPMVTDTLRKHLEFQGLTVTDALDMKGVTKHFLPGEIELKAFQAGNDILLFPSDVRVAIMRLEKALEQEDINHEDLRRRCRHVLAAKCWTDAHEAPVPPGESLDHDLHRRDSIQLIRQLHEASLCWVPSPLGIKDLERALAFVNPTQKVNEHQHHQLDKGQRDHLAFHDSLKQESIHTHILSVGEPADLDPDSWILSIHGLAVKAKDQFGLSEASITYLNKLIAGKPACIVLFGSPFVFTHLKGWQHIPVLHAFQESTEAQIAAAKVISGKIQAKGTLSVQVSERFP